MIEYVINYQTGFFAPGTHLEPSSETIGKLLEGFKGKELFPTTVTEIHFAPSQKSRLQLNLITKQNEWAVLFEPHRFLVKRINIVGIEMPSPSAFIAEAESIISTLIDIFPMKGTRLSYVIKGLLPEMTPELLNAFNKRILNLPQFYLDNPPNEWTTRNIARSEMDINGKLEKINVVTDISRKQGSLFEEDKRVQSDRIELGFDINTFQGNVNQRFDENDLGSFLRMANDLAENIIDQLRGFIDE